MNDNQNASEMQNEGRDKSNNNGELRMSGEERAKHIKEIELLIKKLTESGEDENPEGTLELQRGVLKQLYIDDGLSDSEAEDRVYNLE